MVRRVTADTNVYISALNFGGIPERLLNFARAGLLELAVSDAILAEIERVLTIKFHWTPGLLEEALLEIATYSKRIQTTLTLDLVTEDPTDNRILECAVEARSEYIISGDRHLLHLGEHAGIRILRPSELLDLLRE